MSAIDWLGRELAAAGRAIVHAPVRAYRWLVENASRVLAIVWLAGVAWVVVMTLRRVIRLQREERDDPAVIAAAKAEAAADGAADHGDGPPQAVQLMDVDEINGIQNDRMHALGLSAAGDTDDPDQAAIDAARANRGKTTVAEGDAAGGAGNIVVVSKGGIAGWIQRNKGKRADPETLAWLRGEEKADGRAAYAGWADSGDGDLMGWMMRNKGKAAGSGASVATPGPADGSGRVTSGSASGSATTVPPAVPPAAAPASPPPSLAIDVHALGTAAVFAMSPAAAALQRQATLAALEAQLPAPLVARIRGRRIVIALPADALFGASDATELTSAGAATVRRLGALVARLHDRDLEIRGAPDRALEIAAALAVGGVDPDHLALAAVGAGSGSDAGAAAAALELVLREAP